MIVGDEYPVNKSDSNNEAESLKTEETVGGEEEYKVRRDTLQEEMEKTELLNSRRKDQEDTVAVETLKKHNMQLEERVIHRLILDQRARRTDYRKNDRNTGQQRETSQDVRTVIQQPKIAIAQGRDRSPEIAPAKVRGTSLANPEQPVNRQAEKRIRRELLARPPNRGPEVIRVEIGAVHPAKDRTVREAVEASEEQRAHEERLLPIIAALTLCSIYKILLFEDELAARAGQVQADRSQQARSAFGRSQGD